MPKYEYECALSGITAAGQLVYAKDGLDDMPPYWIEVKLTRRFPNPEYVAIQQLKAAQIEGTLAQLQAQMAQLPEVVQQAQNAAIRLQVKAQFFALESSIEPYITESESVWISPPEANEEVAEALAEVKELLGFDSDGDGGSLQDEDEEDDEEDEQEVRQEIPGVTMKPPQQVQTQQPVAQPVQPTATQDPHIELPPPKRGPGRPRKNPVT